MNLLLFSKLYPVLLLDRYGGSQNIKFFGLFLYFFRISHASLFVTIDFFNNFDILLILCSFFINFKHSSYNTAFCKNIF